MVSELYTMCNLQDTKHVFVQNMHMIKVVVYHNSKLYGLSVITGKRESKHRFRSFSKLKGLPQQILWPCAERPTTTHFMVLCWEAYHNTFYDPVLRDLSQHMSWPCAERPTTTHFMTLCWEAYHNTCHDPVLKGLSQHMSWPCAERPITHMS
jgi:hypothetical protein